MLPACLVLITARLTMRASSPTPAQRSQRSTTISGFRSDVAPMCCTTLFVPHTCPLTLWAPHVSSHMLCSSCLLTLTLTLTVLTLTLILAPFTGCFPGSLTILLYFSSLRFPHSRHSVALLPPLSPFESLCFPCASLSISGTRASPLVSDTRASLSVVTSISST